MKLSVLKHGQRVVVVIPLQGTREDSTALEPVPSKTFGHVVAAKGRAIFVARENGLRGWYPWHILGVPQKEYSVAGSRSYKTKDGWSGSEQYPTLKVHATSEAEAVKIAHKAYRGNGLVELGLAGGKPIENVHGEAFPHPKGDMRYGYPKGRRPRG